MDGNEQIAQALVQKRIHEALTDLGSPDAAVDHASQGVPR
jgi:hypothetical protein